MENSAAGISKESFLQMCEQSGFDPDPEEIPPLMGEFPIEVQDAFNILNRLPDRFQTVNDYMLYIGKDYTTIPNLYNGLGLDPYYLPDVIDYVIHMDSFMIKKARQDYTSAMKKHKKK